MDIQSQIQFEKENNVSYKYIYSFNLEELRILSLVELKMTISATPSIKDECLTVRGKVVLRDVPPSVVVSPASDESAFHGAAAASPNSYHVFNLGILEAQDDMPLQVKNLVVDTKFWKFRTRCACRNTNASYRSKGRVYSGWCIHDSTTENTFYILLLPHLDGSFGNS
ncbi:uncharacterized protein LOC112535776 [Ricinus communis]|uniref:uncharacterized protein LOC112535776 n=1 Tax=Ricinus communis TaxID=3988 RepID=UPI00201B17E4|nr:uncharacterized protein LOC112535776 [Ricinus communis]